MRHEYSEPREIVIIFTKRPNGTCKKPLHIQRCISLKTGQMIIVTYLAKDDKPHRHKYHHSHIMLISSREEVIFDRVHNSHPINSKKELS